jgi:AcrR family transcriptional regulator
MSGRKKAKFVVKKNAKKPNVAKESAQPRKRMSAASRKKEFVDNAVAYFAEFGFDGGTRDLARRLNVSQPLLYRYFPSKEALVGEVYKRVYLDRFRPEWDALLVDRSMPLRQRLQHFYEVYTNAIFEPHWLRIFLFSGLKGGKINKWYLKIVEDRILKPIIQEFRAEYGLRVSERISREEVELAWILHGSVFYYGVRKFVYEVPVLENKAQMIANSLAFYLEGMSRFAGVRDQAEARPVLKSAAE